MQAKEFGYQFGEVSVKNVTMKGRQIKIINDEK